MNYKQAEDYIFSYTDYEKMPVPHDPAFYDLRRVDELLERLGNPHLGAKTVHIAGTKGKGSVAAMMASALSRSGYKTGLYTSPHLHIWRERMRVNDVLISEAEFVALAKKLKPEVEEVNREATYGVLTTFELLTALGFSFFKLKGVDFQVLEVGMGGQFDATNVINPDVAIITSISLDHTEVLGDTVAKIAGEKAGIIKAGTTVVMSPQVEEAADVIRMTCHKRGAELIEVGRDITWQSPGFDAGRQSIHVRGRLDTYKLSIPLLGQYQLENAAVSVAVLEVLMSKGFKVTRDSIIRGLAEVNWPGRLQIVSQSPMMVVDGAHNPDSANKLRHALELYFGLSVKKGAPRSLNPSILVIGVSSDKEIAGIVAELALIFDGVVVTRSQHPRSMLQSRIIAEFTKYGVETEVTDDVPGALTLALKKAGNSGFVCIAGSLFVVGEAIEHMKELHPLAGGV